MTGREISRLEECYSRGVHLVNREKNYSYAHELFAQCVAAAPGSLLYAEALLQNLRRLSPRKQSLLWRLISNRRNAPLRKMLVAGEWQSVIRLGVDLLRHDPWNVDALRSMATACEKLRYNESELVYLKQALSSSPDSIEVNRHCAHSLARMGQIEQAIACWHRIERLDKNNSEAAEMISRLCDDRLRYPEGKLPIAGSRKGEASAADASAQVAASSNRVLSPVEELEQAIADNPLAPEAYLHLAEFYFERGRHQEALKTLQRGLTSCTNQSKLNDLLQLIENRQRNLESESQKCTKQADRLTDIALPAIPWLELTLLGAIALLVLQFLPAVGTRLLAAVDVTQWSRATWAMLNLYLLVGLMLFRYRSEIVSLWRKA